MRISRTFAASALAIIICCNSFSAVAETHSTGATPPADVGILPPVIQSEQRRQVPPAPVVPAEASNGQLPNNVVAWDAETKEAALEPGKVDAHFTFSLTNVSSAEVTIMNVHTSCGCTAAKLPPMPWKIAAGESGKFDVTMNVAGKSGVVFKTVTVSTDKGNKSLMVKTVIPAASTSSDPEVAMTERDKNQMLALTDRTAIFKGDCVSCHVNPTVGKMGHELYEAACGICHEAEHRATMVPDLHALNYETSRELWRVWITYGKTGSLMPGFAKSQGGPLTDAQIDSLVDYLSKKIPGKPRTIPAASHASVAK
jgi:cytochrome c553